MYLITKTYTVSHLTKIKEDLNLTIIRIIMENLATISDLNKVKIRIQIDKVLRSGGLLNQISSPNSMTNVDLKTK